MGRELALGFSAVIFSWSAAISSTAWAVTSLGSGAAVTCGQIQFLASVDQAFRPVYEPSDYTIQVEPSVRGKYGYVAHTIAQKGAAPIDDYDVQIVTQPFAVLENLVPVIRVMLPLLDGATVMAARISDIGVDANRKGGGGARIYELIDLGGEIVGRIAQLGFGYGLCGL